MKVKFLGFICFAVLFFSCKDDNSAQLLSQQKDSQKKEVIFQTISKNWKFTIPDLQPESQKLVSGWVAWRLFMAELKQSPKSSIGAFQKKAKTLTKFADSLNKTIPVKLQKPAIKSRIVVLMTQVRNLDLYLNLQNIPSDKAIYAMSEINLGLASLQLQLDEMVRRTQIPTEIGEPDLIRIQDTARAIPDVPSNANQNIR